MTQNGHQQGDARAQAADWFARLKTLPVSRDTLEQFFEWRRVDGHGAAFDEVERLWGRAGEIADHPDIVGATDDAYHRGSRRPARHQFAAIAISALMIVLAGGAFIAIHKPGDRYVTDVGQQSVVALADGSKVALDTDTDLVVRLDKDARHVALDHGQAYFTVAHDPSRPFTVEADGDHVIATGTQFDVRHTGQATEVTLVEGRVNVRPAGSSDDHVMHAGQTMVLAAGRDPIVRSGDTVAATSWKTGQIVLDGMTLAEAVKEVNRYTARPVTLDAPRYADAKVGGSFETGDIGSFVAATTALLPLRAERGRDGSIHLTEQDSRDPG